MLRSIGAVIAGYLALFVITFVSFTITYQVLRADGSFKPGTYDASGTWIAISIIVGLITAIVGGWVCATIAKGRGAVWGLVVLVLVLGIAGAVVEMTATKPEAPPRLGDVPMFEAMTHARQPVGLCWLFPVIGSVGVLLGAQLKRPRQP
jgi:hypothetical protein